MSRHQLRIGISCALLLAASVGPSVAQQSALETAPEARMHCGGQYECVEDRPLTAEEARASLGYPQVAQSPDEARIAARQQPATEKSVK